jgi:hypothetical protein
MYNLPSFVTEELMHFSDFVKVLIDLDRVAKNLRRPDGSSAGEATARSFLKSAGFDPTADGAWVGPRHGLGRLNHSEVLDVQAIGAT